MSFASILEQVKEQEQKKIAAKLPAWAELGINVPSSLALEQCSSSATAAYKAQIALDFVLRPIRAPKPATRLKRIVDITGGLGVDAAAFSQVAEQVDYYERNAELAQAARENAVKIGTDNIVFQAQEIDEKSVLGQADLVFADPARRDAAGKKVFKIEDCSPNILKLKPLLMSCAPCLMLKLSPMADIAQIMKEIGEELREVHIVGDSEVKELLCLLRRDSRGKFEIRVAQLGIKSESFSYDLEQEKVAELLLAKSISKGDVLLDPMPVLRKAGAFKLYCQKWGVEKLAPSTHLYRAEKKIDSNLFRQFSVEAVLPFNKKSLSELRGMRADVSTHNLPLSSEELRSKLGIKQSGDIHIFGCSCAEMGRVLILAKPFR